MVFQSLSAIDQKYLQAKSGLIMEEDSKSVAKMLKSQIASLAREREERQHVAEAPPGADSGYGTIHTGDQLVDLASASDGQMSDNVQQVFIPQPFYIQPMTTHVQQVFHQVSFCISWLIIFIYIFFYFRRRFCFVWVIVYLDFVVFFLLFNWERS